MLPVLLALAALLPAVPGEEPPGPAQVDALWVRGMTISCQTWGVEWGSDGFAAEVDELRGLGVNWLAIHPYAAIAGDGRVSWRALDPGDPPAWIARPIREAHARGLSILVVPHLAHWHSPFASRAAIAFDDPAARARFFETYAAWMVALARAARGADALSVGSELERMVTHAHEADWRRLIARLRAATDARLTYAANWDGYAAVPFWDALDAIGVQAYFPLSAADDPSEEQLAAGWRPVLDGLRALSRRTGKPVVFTELGYDRSPDAAREPWAWRRPRGPEDARDERADALQARCLRVALRTIAAEREWLRGAFLWKWFVGPARGETFVMDRPPLRAEIAAAWTSTGR